jgi:hypothetical protein
MYFANGDTHSGCFQTWVGFGLCWMPVKRIEEIQGSPRIENGSASGKALPTF